MPKQAAFTVELEADLRHAGTRRGRGDRPAAARVVRDLIDDFVHQQRDAREHDAWFRAEVEQGLREADDPTVKRIANEEIRASWRRQRTELLERIAGEQGRN